MDNDQTILQALAGRRLSAAELIGVTQIPSSTLYKRLARLRDDGLIEVHADPQDGRLKTYALREAARPAMRRRAASPASEAAPPGPAKASEPAGGAGEDAPDTGDGAPDAPAPDAPPQREPSPPAAPQTAAAQGERAAQPPALPEDHALSDAEVNELADLLLRFDRLGMHRAPEYDALRRLLAREQAARGLVHSRAYR